MPASRFAPFGPLMTDNIPSVHGYVDASVTRPTGARQRKRTGTEKYPSGRICSRPNGLPPSWLRSCLVPVLDFDRGGLDQHEDGRTHGLGQSGPGSQYSGQIRIGG